MKIISFQLEVEMVTNDDKNDRKKWNIYENDGKFIEFEIQSI